MRQHKGWSCCTFLILPFLYLLRQGLAARPEDAVFMPGTLPLDDAGKEVLFTLTRLLMSFCFQLAMQNDSTNLHSGLVTLILSCRSRRMVGGF